MAARIKTYTPKLRRSTYKGDIEASADAISDINEDLEFARAEKIAARKAALAGHTSETSELINSRDEKAQGEKYRNEYAKKGAQAVLGIIGLGVAIAALASGIGAIALGPLLTATAVLGVAGAIGGGIYGEMYGRNKAKDKQHETRLLTQGKERLREGYEERQRENLEDMNYYLSNAPGVSDDKKVDAISKAVLRDYDTNHTRANKSLSAIGTGVNSRTVDKFSDQINKAHDGRPSRLIGGGRIS